MAPKLRTLNRAQFLARAVVMRSISADVSACDPVHQEVRFLERRSSEFRAVANTDPRERHDTRVI